MSKFFLRFLAGFMVFAISNLVLAADDKSMNPCSQPIMNTMQEKANQDSLIFKYGNAPIIVFHGIPNETQTGEMSFMVVSKLGYKSMLLRVTGFAFENGESYLDTEYLPNGSNSWYKAGEPFTMQVLPGATNSIKFRAISGPKISSQFAGAYTVKLSFILLSYNI